MRLCGWCRQLAGDDRASEVAEAALVLPLVFTLLLGIIWFGRAFNIYSTITYAAREGARVAVMGATSSCATCGTPPTPATAAAAAATRVNEVLRASHIDLNQMQVYIPSPAPVACGGGAVAPIAASGINVYADVLLNPASAGIGPPACGVVVSFEYKYKFYFPFTSLDRQTIFLKAAGQMTAEN